MLRRGLPSRVHDGIQRLPVVETCRYSAENSQVRNEVVVLHNAADRIELGSCLPGCQLQLPAVLLPLFDTQRCIGKLLFLTQLNFGGVIILDWLIKFSALTNTSQKGLLWSRVLKLLC